VVASGLFQNILRRFHLPPYADSFCGVCVSHYPGLSLNVVRRPAQSYPSLQSETQLSNPLGAPPPNHPPGPHLGAHPFFRPPPAPTSGAITPSLFHPPAPTGRIVLVFVPARGGPASIAWRAMSGDLCERYATNRMGGEVRAA